MDWKYKHFKQAAVFNAPFQRVREAARSAVGGTLKSIEDTPDGFIARGYSGWHTVEANFHIASAASGTQVNVELLAQRYGYGGFMLWDIGGYYNAEIDRWFASITEELGGAAEQALVSKTTSGNWIQRGCIGGCLIWMVGGVCLGIPAMALDRAVFPKFPASLPGPFASVVSLVAFAAGVVGFIYMAYPESPLSKSIRARLRRRQDTGRD